MIFKLELKELKILLNFFKIEQIFILFRENIIAANISGYYLCIDETLRSFNEIPESFLANKFYKVLSSLFGFRNYLTYTPKVLLMKIF